MSNLDIGTECETLDKKTTQYIERNISQKFFDVCTELRKSKVPDSAVLRGISIAMTKCFIQVKETKGSDSDIADIIDQVVVVLNNAIERGVNFPSQATALAIVIQCVLGIKFENME